MLDFSIFPTHCQPKMYCQSCNQVTVTATSIAGLNQQVAALPGIGWTAISPLTFYYRLYSQTFQQFYRSQMRWPIYLAGQPAYGPCGSPP